jgi:hypothetical protein
MLSTKNLISDVKLVPSTWIFEHYCKLPDKLVGQDLKVKSLFNPKERTPSMCIYFDQKKSIYKFKDFSTDTGGGAIDLVKHLYQCSFGQASGTIIEDYNEFILHNNGGFDVQEFKSYSKYRVKDTTTRPWTTADQYYWTKFNIGSRLLDEHNVRPLQSYIMAKEEDGQNKELEILGKHLYGYFTSDNQVYKIYQPTVKDKKFIKVANYIQGSEQLKGHDYLVITSSLKDLMALKSLKLSVDVIAPDSENTMIKQEVIDKYKNQYKKIITIFDNDEAGLRAMKKYQEHYDIPYVHLKMSKDLADAIRDFGPREVMINLVPLITKHVVDNESNNLDAQA